MAKKRNKLLARETRCCKEVAAAWKQQRDREDTARESRKKCHKEINLSYDKQLSWQLFGYSTSSLSPCIANISEIRNHFLAFKPTPNAFDHISRTQLFHDTLNFRRGYCSVKGEREKCGGDEDEWKISKLWWKFMAFSEREKSIERHQLQIVKGE